MEISNAIEMTEEKSRGASAPPKIFEKLAYFFPMFQLLLVSSCLILFIRLGSLWILLGLLISIYILPVLIWRIFSFFYPLSEKNAYIGKQEKETHSWFISYKLQSLFISFPFFERILILIPGAFSTWLRLWGSQIGHKITWTPRVDIVDRASLEIKDYAIFGDKVYLSAHIIIRKNNRLMLLHKKIKVGEKCLIGYASELGPGANVPDNEMLPALSRAYMNRIIRGGANESAN